jgi:hypothetical protein
MMKGTFPSVRYTAVDNLYSGPYSGRKATKAAYVEFASAEAATDFFKEVKSNHSSKLSIGGKELDVKPARTKLNGQRNYSIRQAHDLIKSHPQANNKEVEFDWPLRQIKVNSSVAFMHGKYDTGGTFKPPYSDLSLE